MTPSPNQLELPARRLHKIERRVAPRSWGVWAVAASLLLISALVMLQLPLLQRLNSDVATAVGERRQIQLADGSRLTLDSASAVDVDLRGPVRTLRLVQGQVFIEVTHDGRPFVVNIDQAQVQVLGTRFSVSRGRDHDEVVLLKGKVEVSIGGDKRMLAPGERVTLNGSRLDQVEKVDAERRLAWREVNCGYATCRCARCWNSLPNTRAAACCTSTNSSVSARSAAASTSTRPAVQSMLWPAIRT
ncbi:transmembrane sensor [Pseudomonas donghuensis]|uniref:FecR family protein n=1 Tax=Pseudomonas donghuensis TaxID=1163398 RepID=UPI0039E03C93